MRWLIGFRRRSTFLTYYRALKSSTPPLLSYPRVLRRAYPGGALRQAWRAELPLASVGYGFCLEEEIRPATGEDLHGKRGSGQEDITALGGVFESRFIPGFKSPSRLAICYKSPRTWQAGLYTTGSGKKEFLQKRSTRACKHEKKSTRRSKLFVLIAYCFCICCGFGLMLSTSILDVE